MEDRAGNMDKQLKTMRILQDFGSKPISPSPYVKTRIVAEVMSRREKGLKLRFWRRVSFAACFLLIVGITTTLIPQQGDTIFPARAGQAVAVRVDVQELDHLDIAHAQIQLPDGVRFHVEGLSEFEAQRSLTLRWTNERDLTHFVFLIKAGETGTRDVKVRFLDGNKTLVAERTVRIRFERT